MSLVQVHDLETWGRTVDAREKLGNLLARLIRATTHARQVQSLRFLDSVATQLPGWDGLVEATSGNEFVPRGQSVWELGSGNGEVGKIRRDFRNRQAQDLPNGWGRTTVTYVAVTLSKLQDPDGVREELRGLGGWQDVKILDVVGLRHWLDIAGAVDIWMHEQCLGRPVEGIQTLEGAWSDWALITKPHIHSSLVSVAREQDTSEICQAISEGTELQIHADSPDEGIALIHAAVSQLPDDFRNNVISRSLMISSKDAVLRFPRAAVPQLLVLKDSAVGYAGRLEGDGHQVIQVLGKSARSRRAGLVLARQPRQEFAEALQTMGKSEGDAFVEAKACGASASVWRVWNLMHVADASAILPSWAAMEHLEATVPAILLGGWSESNDSDMKVAEVVSGLEYERFRDELLKANSVGDPLFQVAGDTLVVSAPATAFAIVSKSIGRSVIQRFAKQLAHVFAQIDPEIEIAPDQRMYAGSEGRQLAHSEWLRSGMAGTLLRIAVLGEDLEQSGVLGPGVGRHEFANSCIRDLPGLRDNFRLLASLRDQLPVLAEAAPVPFLEALETLLQGDRDGLASMFAESSEFGGHALHPGLLWALECLAWQREHFSRAVQALASLDELDPGGRLANRPINSLSEIFLPWHPGTAASVGERCAALTAINQSHPETGWKLLTNLMPSAHQVSSGTHRPEWLEVRSGPVTRKEIAELYSAYIELAIDSAGCEAGRLVELVKAYQGFSPKHRETVEVALRRSVDSLDQQERFPVWSEVRNLVARHREFPDAAWALEEDVLARLEELCPLLEPRDPLLRYGWLFDDYYPDLPTPKTDHESFGKEVDRQRTAAIAELWGGDQNIDFLLKFAEKAQFPGFVARSFFLVESDVNTLLQVFIRAARGTQPLRTFATVLSEQVFAKIGDAWTEMVIAASNDPDLVTSAILGYPDSLEQFEYVRSLGTEIETQYWKRHGAIISSQDSDAIKFAIDMFLKFARARDALISIAQGKIDAPPSMVICVLNQTWEELNQGLQPELNSGSTGYWIERLLQQLREDPMSEKSEVARVEYRYMPILARGLEKKDLVLHEILASDPQFFMDVICDLFKPEHQDAREEDGTPSKERQSRAHIAWDLLRSWETPPGVGGEGQLEYAALNNWIEEVRKLAAERDRAKVTDQQIGKVLYHIRADADDCAWPDRALRDILEKLSSRHIELGIEIEQVNSRGVTSRGMYEGGVQERDLASQWKNWADTVGPRWPRTQAMLLRISKAWEMEAEREDVSAQKNKMRYQ